MKQFLAAAAAALLVVACSNEPAPETAQKPGQSPEATAEGAARKARPLKKALPEGVELGFRYHLVSDRVVNPDGRGARRRVALEYLELDQAQIFDSVGKSLADAGFKLRDRKNPENGNIRAKFGKPKFGVVVVTVTPAEEKRRHPDAIGRVVLDWPVHESKAAQTVPENVAAPGTPVEAE